MTTVSPADPSAPSAQPAAPSAQTAVSSSVVTLAEEPWRRLSIRMLAVHPVIELIRALPAIVALLIVGSQRENGEWWGYFGIGVPVVIGLARWATTRYRITPTQIQVRRGLWGRSVRTVPRDRVRSVDLTSHLMHRLLGLTRVAVGTGQVDRQKDSGVVLDGLSKHDAARLREELLHSRGGTPSGSSATATTAIANTAIANTATANTAIANTAIANTATANTATGNTATADTATAPTATAATVASATAGIAAVVPAVVPPVSPTSADAAHSPGAVLPADDAYFPGGAPPAGAVPTGYAMPTAGTAPSAGVMPPADSRPGVGVPGSHVGAPAPTFAETTLARLEPAWIRYGPFTMSGLVSIGVLATFAWRTINEAHLDPDQFGPFHAFTGQLGGLPVAGAIAEIAALGLVLVAFSSTVAYVMAFWNFQLSRTSSGTLHVSRGLLTTRSTTIEERRLRGVEISEPLLLRAVGAARCMAITTGLRYGRGAERGGSLLLPPAPVAEARRVAAQVLRGTGALTVPLVRHSRAAARRRVSRALIGAAILVGLFGLLSWRLEQAGWVITAAVVLPPCALWLARDRFRSLGHAIVDGRLVLRVGSLARRRYMIDREGIIGWKIRQSFFQRRSGLVTLTATTAAGRQHYGLLDVDEPIAIMLADTALPGLLEPFLLRH